MSPQIRGRNVRGSVLAVISVALVLGGGVGVWKGISAIAGNGGNGPPVGNIANPGVYNVFVAPSADPAVADANTAICKWYATPVATPTSGAGTGCGTLQKAMILSVQNRASGVNANVGIWGSSTKYIGTSTAPRPWDICTANLTAAQGRYNAQCATQEAGNDFIDYWRIPASTADPTQVGSLSMEIGTSRIRIHGPLVEDTSGCDRVNQSGSGLCPTLSISEYTSGSPDKPIPHDVLVENFKASKFFITSAYNVTIRNSDFGPATDDHGIVHIKSCGPTPPQVPCVQSERPHDILLDNVVVHDQYNSTFCLGPTRPCGPEHMGCGPTFNDSYNVTIQNSKFYNCEDTAMLIKPGAFPTDHISFINDYFGESSNGLQINGNSCSPGCVTDVSVINTTFAANNGGKLQILGGAVTSCSNCVVRGNILNSNPTLNGFGPGWTFDYNYSTQSVLCGGGASCSNNVQVASLGLDTDFIHLLPTSPLQHVLPSGLPWMPLTDIDGQTRSNLPSPGADDGTFVAPDGDSLAVCSPEPCNQPTSTTITGLQFDDGAGKNRTQSYTIWRSSNLTNSPTNKVPVVMADCGSATAKESGTETLLTVAAANHFIVVCANPPSHRIPDSSCGTPPCFTTVYVRGSTGQINVTGSPSGASSDFCGNTGDQPCDDTPMIVAQLADIQSNRTGSTQQNIDPKKVWAAGGSNGGQFYAWELMCNPLSSSLFSGFGQISALFQSVTQATPTICPAVDSGNKDFSWATAWGTNDNALINTCTTPWTDTHCEPGILGGGTSHWYYGPLTGVSLMRDTSHLDCPDSTLVTTTPATNWRVRTWSCPGTGNGVAEYRATNAGHAVGSLQGYQGFNMWQSIWDFWTSHWRGP